MKKYVKNYLKHHGHGEQDVILCEQCGVVAVDIHHRIPRSIFANKCPGGDPDDIMNLIALCRSCSRFDAVHARAS